MDDFIVITSMDLPMKDKRERRRLFTYISGLFIVRVELDEEK